MTTFAELQALVVGQTRRPEVTDITDAAIRTATLRAHHVDFFSRDLAPGSLTYTVNHSVKFYDFPSLSTSLPRIRSLQMLQCTDSVTLAPTETLEYRELNDLYDSDNNQRLSVYTLIGNTLRIYPQVATGSIGLYYYQNPNVQSLTYSSWIADEYPDDLAVWAAAIVFARTGFAEMAADFQKTHIAGFKEMLIASSLLGTVN